jgi:hypothetical protein
MKGDGPSTGSRLVIARGGVANIRFFYIHQRVEPVRAVSGTGIIQTISGPLCHSAQRDSTMPKVPTSFAPGQAAQPFAAT